MDMDSGESPFIIDLEGQALVIAKPTSGAKVWGGGQGLGLHGVRGLESGVFGDARSAGGDGIAPSLQIAVSPRARRLVGDVGHGNL